MCGRYNIEPNLIAWLDAFEILGQIDRERDLRAQYNIPPTSVIPVIRFIDGRLVLSMMRWNFVPGWLKDEKPRTMNCARGETVATNGYFKRSFAKQRCIVPASGFYEWKQDVKPKEPYNIRLIDGSPLLMAGVWDCWRGEENVAIITVGPNAVMEPIHERMPVIINRELMIDWLTTSTPENYLHPAPDDMIYAYRVSTEVNNARSQGAHLITPLAI